MKIISGILILVTVYLNIKHGWAGLSNRMSPEESKMLSDLGIGATLMKVISIASLAGAVLVLIPQTFFAGNLVNAATILLIMSLALKTENFKTALIEIPFLLIPLALMWLGHPLKA